MDNQSSSKKQNVLLKYQVIIVAIMTILGVVLGNSLYLDGYTAETMEAGVPFIYSSYGYDQTENSFAYTGVEGSCVQLLARSSDTEQLMFVFSEAAKEDKIKDIKKQHEDIKLLSSEDKKKLLLSARKLNSLLSELDKK